MRNRFLILLIPFVLFGCDEAPTERIKEKIIGGPKEERVIPVTLLSIDSTSGIVSNTYPGYLEEGQSIDLTFKYGGTLEEVYVSEGNYVAKGQQIAKVSSPTLENSLRTAQATKEQALDAYDRLKKVHDNGSLPEIKWKEMEANLEKAESAYDLAYAMLEENRLISPISGTVAFIDAKVGENITPMKPVARIINTTGIAVKISVPEDEISKIRIGDRADIVIPALGDCHFTGKVSEKSMTSSLLTHSYPVKVLVEKPSKELSPGMIGKVMLKADVNNGIIIPANAILINQEGKFVWVEENGRSTRRPITTSGYSGKGVVVTQGLQCGDHVIVEGYQKVSEGMKVTAN